MARPKKIQNLAENIKPSDKAPQIIFPDVRVAGENHPLEDMWIDGNFPGTKGRWLLPDEMRRKRRRQSDHALDELHNDHKGP